MRRRRFIAFAGVSALAGCGSDGGDDGGSDPTPTPDTLATESPSATATATPTSTDSPTPSPSPTPTPTPSPGPPEIQFVNPVSHWEDFGDASDNEVDSIGAGGWLYPAMRIEIYAHGGTISATHQVRVYDGSERVGRTSESFENLVEESGYRRWEIRPALDTSGWDEGEYTGESLVRDDKLEETSAAAEWDVELVAPLTGDEVALDSVAVPASVAPDADYTLELDIENRTDRDSSIVSQSSRTTGEQWRTRDDVRLNIPGDSVRYLDLSATAPSTPGEYEYRIDGTPIRWELSVEEQ